MFLRSVVSFSFRSASPFFLPFACFYVLAVCNSFFVSLCFSLLFSPSACIPPRFFYLLLAVCFCWSLPASVYPLPNPTTPPPPLPLLGALTILAFPLLLPVPCWSPFFLLLRTPSASFLRFLSDSLPLALAVVLSLSLSCLSPSLVALLQGCLSVLVRIRL